MIEAVICIVLLLAFAWLPLIFTIRYTFKLIEKIPADAWKRAKKTDKTSANNTVQDTHEKSVQDALKGFTEEQIRGYMFNRYMNGRRNRK